MALDRKIAYIDLTKGEIEKKPIPINMRKMYLGGRGLDMYLLYNHIKPGIDALGPDNVSVVSAGVLGATLASASSRTHVAGKSPLTGYVGSTNMGGFFAPEMRWAGFDHLVIKGKAKKPVYIWIHNGEIEIRDASNIWGKDTHETREIIRQDKQNAIDAVLTDDIKAQLAAIDAEFDPLTDAVNETAGVLEGEVKIAVLSHGASVKGEYTAVFSRGRTSWDTKALNGYAAAHPEIEQFRKVGNPSVSIRRK